MRSSDYEKATVHYLDPEGHHGQNRYGGTQAQKADQTVGEKGGQSRTRWSPRGRRVLPGPREPPGPTGPREPPNACASGEAVPLRSPLSESKRRNGRSAGARHRAPSTHWY